MRKWLLAVLLCLLPVLAWAAPATPYGMETAPRYALLTENQQALLDLLYASAAAGEPRADLPEGTLYDDAAAAMEALILDFPELVGLQSEYALGYYQHQPEVATYAELRYSATGEALQAMRMALLSAAKALVMGVEGDDFARELTLHDTICSRVRYDLSAPNAHNAYGALVEGRAGCEGYAQAMTLLCRMAGMPCTMVTGMAWDGTYMRPHAWNMVQIGGHWGHVDATYNDQQEILHWYFNLSEGQLSADHTWDSLPFSAPEEAVMEYHCVLNQTASSLEEAENLLLAGMQKGAVSIRFMDEKDYLAFTGDVAGTLERANQRAETPFYGAYRVMVSPQQRCVMVVFGE